MCAELLSQLVVMMMMMGARTRTLRFTCVTSRWTRDPEAQVLPWSQVSLNASPIKGNSFVVFFFPALKTFPNVWLAVALASSWFLELL